MKPRMFIASSAEKVDLAYAAQEGLEHDVEATVWSQGVFQLSRTAMASLIDAMDESDFGLFIFSPDDVAAIRDESKKIVRDNVVFELGLFVGRLGIERCFVVIPNNVDELHLPTDLLGLTPATFDPSRQDGNLVAALGPACSRIRKAVIKLGSARPAQAKLPPVEQEGELCADPNDCKAIIQSWMGSRPADLNAQVIRYDDVDRELKLKPGSARQYIEEVATRWGYVPSRKGKDTILFQSRDRY